MSFEEEEANILENHFFTIYDAMACDETVPHGFNGVKIFLDGTVKGDLSWKKELEAATRYAALGLYLFWEIDLGLFDRLPFGLSNQSQFLSLCLSLEHFQKTLWDKFSSQTIGLCLYRGKADFRSLLNLSDRTKVEMEGKEHPELKACDIAADYLHLLANHLPPSLNCFVLLDTGMIQSPCRIAHMLAKSRFPNVRIGVRNGRGLGGELSWDDEPLKYGVITRQLPPLDKGLPVRIGVALPDSAENTQKYDRLFFHLMGAKVPFKVIPESLLNVEWDGLDEIIVSNDHISPQTKRMLDGFKAAGGTVSDYF